VKKNVFLDDYKKNNTLQKQLVSGDKWGIIWTDVSRANRELFTF